jgi:hypothetical protein
MSLPFLTEMMYVFLDLILSLTLSFPRCQVINLILRGSIGFARREK